MIRCLRTVAEAFVADWCCPPAALRCPIVAAGRSSDAPAPLDEPLRVAQPWPTPPPGTDL